MCSFPFLQLTMTREYPARLLKLVSEKAKKRGRELLCLIDDMRCLSTKIIALEIMLHSSVNEDVSMYFLLVIYSCTFVP